MPGTWLSIQEVAELADVAPATVRAYLARGQMPEPDEMIGRSPVWRKSTITRWLNRRHPARVEAKRLPAKRQPKGERR